MQTKIQNTQCSKSGITKTYNRVVLVCTKVGSRLLWQPAPIQKLMPIIPSKSSTFQPILAFTSLPNSESQWSEALVNEAVVATQEAFRWWNLVTNGNLKFINPTILKPIQTAKASACDPKIAGVDVINKSQLPKIIATTRVITFSLNAKCQKGAAGIAEIRGNYVLIKSSANKSPNNPMEEPFYFNAAVIAHELGHTLGLDHAGSITCETSSDSIKYFINRKCEFYEYGDLADIMGGSTQLYCVNTSGEKYPLISNLQRFVALGQIRPLAITQPGSYPITSFYLDKSKSLYYINTDYGVAYLEYKNLDESTCAYQSTGSRSYSNINTYGSSEEFKTLQLISKPSIQVRLLGNDQFDPIAKNRYFGLDYVTLARKKERSYTEILADGRESSISWNGEDINFQLGESVEIPNTNFKLTLKETEAGFATIEIVTK